jgi:putative transposase
MRFTPTIISKLLEAVNRRQFQAIVDRHDGDAYDKSFKSWDHLVVLIFAQFSAGDSLRGLEAGWNASRQHHYHLGSGPLMRSTLSDANRRRPVPVFAEAFALVAAQLDRQTRSESADMVQLIDSTPIPLGKLCDWAKSNGRIHGLKVHVAYDPQADYPRLLDVTDATVNDAQIGRTIQIKPGTAYVFDKGYCHYGWWKAIDQAGSVFVTRPKKNMGLEVVEVRQIPVSKGEGFLILEDSQVRLASKGDSKLAMPLRRLKIMRRTGQIITLITNDMTRSALEIAQLYKGRWQIELLFRWIKQHLRIRKFLGNNDNAIRLQLYAAMIAYALLRIAARANAVKIDILRYTELIAQCLFERRHIGAIDIPPPTNPTKKHNTQSPDQIAFFYA